MLSGASTDLLGPPESSYVHLKCKADRLVDLERAYPAEVQRKQPANILGKCKQSPEYGMTSRKEMRISPFLLGEG